MAVDQVERELGDVGFVGLDRRFVLLDEKLLIRIGLLGDRLALVQLRIAREIGARLGERRLVLGELSFGLALADFVLARIDLREELTFLHVLPFAVADGSQVAAQLRQYGDGGDGRDRAQFAQDFRHRSGGGGGDRHDLGRNSGFGRLRAQQMERHQCDQRQQHDREYEAASSGTPRLD